MEMPTKNTVRYGQPNTALIKSWLRMDPADDGPFWAVNLMKYREVADYTDGRETTRSGRDADDEYTPYESLRAIGAKIVFAAEVETQLLGDSPKWDRIGVVRYPSRKAFIEMQSRADFVSKHVHKDAGMEQTIVMSCLPMPSPEPPANAPKGEDVLFPPTEEDGPVVVLHVLKFKDGEIDHMSAYTDEAAKIAVPHGVSISGWFKVEGTIVGDGRQWDQARFNAFPSKRAFMAVVTDPARLAAQKEHRETAIADTYTMILRPRTDKLAESIREVRALMQAAEIPVGHTPPGGWKGEMPVPILGECTEPPTPGAPDLRGLWQAIKVEQDGAILSDHRLNQHIERVEQCGNRVVVTSEGVIHDMVADGTLENGVNDVGGPPRFDQPIRVAAVFNGGRLDLHPFGVQPGKPPLVTREIVGKHMIWNYRPYKVTMRRIDQGKV